MLDIRTRYAAAVDTATGKRDTKARIAEVLEIILERHADGASWAVLAGQLKPTGVLARPISANHLRNLVAELVRDGGVDVVPRRPAPAPRPRPEPRPVTVEPDRRQAAAPVPEAIPAPRVEAPAAVAVPTPSVPVTPLEPISRELTPEQQSAIPPRISISTPPPRPPIDFTSASTETAEIPLTKPKLGQMM